MAKPVPAKSTKISPALLALFLALLLVVAGRLLLYAWLPGQSSDFDLLYKAAASLIRGESAYPTAAQSFPYPLPAVLLAVPFSFLPLTLARPLFDVLVGWAFAFALWRLRGPNGLLALMSGAYVFAMASSQTTPLMVAAILVPALGFLLAVRPNVSAALWIARPSWLAVPGAILFLGLSLALYPSWPREWWLTLPAETAFLAPPILRPMGFLLLLAAIKWRTPEARLLLGMAFIPQTTLPYELVALALIPANRLEMTVYVVGSWMAVVASNHMQLAEWGSTGWPISLCTVYVPMLYLVLRRPATSKKGLILAKERRRAHRLPDQELTIDVTENPTGRFSVKITHVPTQLFVTESGSSRDSTVRKAHDRLAALFAETSRLKKTA
ncbi:MAG: hypothetical protein ACJ8AY_03440 [Gemmatimonadales bacterium]